MAEPQLYVGWAARMPPGLARFVRARVACAGALLIAIAAALVASQAPFADSVHEFGIERELEGWIAERPYPRLRVARDGPEPVVSYLLVARGKHGAAERLRGLDGARVKLRATRIYREAGAMLELSDAPLERVEGAAPAPAPRVEDLGERALSGEIVDSKCFLGVMKPGESKVHRACAARCLSGGVPPLFVVRGRGRTSALLLTSASGEPAERAALIEHLAEPLRIRGRVRRIDDWLALAADPASFQGVE